MRGRGLLTASTGAAHEGRGLRAIGRGLAYIACASLSPGATGRLAIGMPLMRAGAEVRL